jgi:hypothetical protein
MLRLGRFGAGSCGLIPVRQPELWSSEPVRTALVETVSFLSDDDYEFEFCKLVKPPPTSTYFQYSGPQEAKFTPDEVILFSGGLDSFAGTVEELARGNKVALISHRSAPKLVDTQNYLINQLRKRFGDGRIRHIPVRAHLQGWPSREHTHRSRSFLFAALGATTAQLLDQKRICFFENGVVSLNLPPAGQVVGARATRTTHPQALAGFKRLLSAVLGQTFDVSNPFAWITKSEVIDRIAQNGCGDLIRHTRSCTRVHAMTNLHPHCGKCSQCIDRRFAVLVAGQEEEDPADAYNVDLLLGERESGPDREMALSFVRSASTIGKMTDADFLARYGETSRIVGFFEEPADTVARRIVNLHWRHAAGVGRVFDAAIGAHASKMREGSLPATCLLLLVVGQGGEKSSYCVRSVAEPPIVSVPEIRVSIDEERTCVVIKGWGEIKGANAKLIVALAEPFRDATRKEYAPEHYPYTKTPKLMQQIDCESDEVLRRRVFRCRNNIKKLAQDAGDTEPPNDAIIENLQWHGYRLNPDRVRLVALSDLPA